MNNENIVKKAFNGSNVLPSDNEGNNYECRNDSFSSSIDDSNQETSSYNNSLLNEIFLKDQIGTCASMLIAKLYCKPGHPRRMIQEYVEDITDVLSTSFSLLSADISAIFQS